ncbi:unnamed protein product [Cunninghamella blakesleeana]
MSLEIDPSDLLTFQRPLTKITEEVLRIRNLKAEPAIFKVKTTAPKQYCVRPNAARIEPFSEIEVHVILQPFKTEPEADFKCKDKFLVQSATISPNEDESLSVTDLWGRIEHSNETTIYQHKIKCAFAPPIIEEEKEIIPETQQVAEIKEIPKSVETIHQIEKEPVVSAETQKQPTQDPVTVVPKAEPAPKVDIPDIPISVKEENTPIEKITSSVDELPQVREIIKEKAPQTVTKTPEIVKIVEEKEEKKLDNNNSNNNNTITSSLSSAGSINNKEQQIKDDDEKLKLKQELSLSQENVIRLQKELDQLKKELQDARSHQTPLENNKTRKLSPTVQPLDAVHQRLAQLQKPHPTEGYPPQIVAIIGLVIFLFTYLFF